MADATTGTDMQTDVAASDIVSSGGFGDARPHAERPSAYWDWRDRLKADPSCWQFTGREEAIAYAAFIEGWYLRTGERPDAPFSPNTADQRRSPE